MMKDDIYQNLSLVKKFSFPGSVKARVFAADIQDSAIHMHDGIELYYVLDGSVDVKVSFNSYHLFEENFLLVNSYEVHRVIRASQSSVILILQIPDCFLDHQLFVFDAFFYQSLNVEKVNEVKSHMLKLYQIASQSPWNEELLRLYEKILNDIVTLCKTYFKMENYRPFQKSLSPFIHHSLHLKRMKHTYHYIYGNFFKRLSLREMAHLEHIDIYYTSRLLKKGLGRTFQDSVNIVRADRAEVYLLSTDLPLSLIASQLGFSSQHYFTKCFTHLFGMTPASYRKKFVKETYPQLPMQVEILDPKSVRLPGIEDSEVVGEKSRTAEQRLSAALQELKSLVRDLRCDHAVDVDGTQIIKRGEQITVIFPAENSSADSSSSHEYK